MCGIIGVIGTPQAAQLVLQGLKQLEYRGYDSAGIATITHDGQLKRARAQGKIATLAALLDVAPLAGSVGIGHTRWATHGAPSERNAHPHMTRQVAVVHNGIIENHQTLRSQLEAKGHIFTSDTDTEVVVHLISDLLSQALAPRVAFEQAVAQLTGSFALGVIMPACPDRLFAARRGAPLAIGYGQGQMFLASDSQALAPFTQRITYLENGDLAEIWADGLLITDSNLREVERAIVTSALTAEDVEKGPYPHFMLKEIFEQPTAVAATIDSLRMPASGQLSPDLINHVAELNPLTMSRLLLTGCGTAYFAALTSRYWLEELAGLATDIDIASELRYRHLHLPQNGAALFFSQSGETLDTLEALRLCQQKGQHIVSIVNKPESSIARESNTVLYNQAGPEIGVASTKAFTTQLAASACLTLALAQLRGTLPAADINHYMQSLSTVPGHMASLLDRVDEIKALAAHFAKASTVLFLGRGNMAPIAMEGALKLKEITYIHAEGFAAGELKHGPLALVDDSVPVVVLAPSGPLFDKVAGNLREVAARGGQILLLSDHHGIAALKDHVRWSFVLPDSTLLTAPLLYTLPLQLLAYYTACHLGLDVDQPRNLAKSVTVE
jgi:glucosamine--fructose-6-phosphate aminotransferase (isomerizing)